MQDVMNTTDIAFPNLKIYLENVPSSFNIGGMEIYLYGVVIGLGLMMGLFMAERAAKVCGMNPDEIWDFAIYAVIFSVLGARIYYVVFQWSEFKGDLKGILNIRQGGLAIYGAVIGAFLTLFIFCKLKKRNPFQLGDCGVQGLVLGQAIGRWGNFFNREVFGEYTNNLFAMRIPIDAVRDPSDITANISSHIPEGANYIQVHPTFLYESALNFVLFFLMVWYHKRKKFNGEICLLYLGGYGIIRFFVEGIRTDQLKFAGTDIAVSQMLGISLFVLAVVLEIIIRLRLSKKTNK
jgi:phosphatidylglycerol:prolipoprotein diacylglycerol transferase